MRARKRWKEAISSIDKLLLYVSPLPFFLLSPVLLCFLTSSDVDLQKLDEALKMQADELLTLKAAGNKSKFYLKMKTKLWWKNPTDNNQVKISHRQESKIK